MFAYLKENPGYVFITVATLAFLFTFGKHGLGGVYIAWDPSATGSVLAELLIAGVIYYEIEENRVAKFLDDAVGKAYKERSKIYKAYMEAPGETWKAKTESFRGKIWEDEDLRKEVDFQLTYFSNAHYLVRRSLLHRGILKEWFPQVIVRMWAMLSAYISDTDRRGIRAAGELAKEVAGSVDVILSTGNFLPLSIHSIDGKKAIRLTEKELHEIKQDVAAYLAR